MQGSLAPAAGVKKTGLTATVQSAFWKASRKDMSLEVDGFENPVEEDVQVGTVVNATVKTKKLSYNVRITEMPKLVKLFQ